MTCDGRQPWINEDLGWKTTLGGRQSWMEDNIWWMTPFDRGQPLIQDDLQSRTTIDWRKLLMKYDFRWKATFNERQPLKAENRASELFFVLFPSLPNQAKICSELAPSQPQLVAIFFEGFPKINLSLGTYNKIKLSLSLYSYYFHIRAPWFL